MGWVKPDGSLSGSAKAIHRLRAEPRTAEQIAAVPTEPLFNLRANLGDMISAAAVEPSGELYSTTETGMQKIESN